MKTCLRCKELSPDNANFCIECAEPFGNVGGTQKLTNRFPVTTTSGSFPYVSFLDYINMPPYLLASGVESTSQYIDNLRHVAYEFRSLEDRINGDIRVAIEQNERNYIIRITRRELLELQRSTHFGVFLGKQGDTIRMYKGFKVEVIKEE